MKVIEFKDLHREEGQIFYIRRYYCVAVLSLPTGTTFAPIKFSIEMNGLGHKDIELQVEGQINYPLIPVRKALMDFILSQDEEGKLPC